MDSWTRYSSSITTLIAITGLTSLLLSASAAPPGDWRTFLGVARGAGEVSLSPQKGFTFSSSKHADVACAATSGALPAAYRIVLSDVQVDTRYSGVRFGIFEDAVRFGGQNDPVNAGTKYCLSFSELRDKRDVFVAYWDEAGDYHCWAGGKWRTNSWVPTGINWSPDATYEITLTKSYTGFSCSVASGGEMLVEAPEVDCSAPRGTGTPDYFAFGDMVSDYVSGTVRALKAQIEAIRLEPYLDQDIEKVVIREAPEGRYAMYAGLTKQPDGELLCVYKMGSVDEKGSPWTVRDEQVVWARSTNDARTWPQEAALIYEDTSARQETCCGKGHLAADGNFMHPFYILNPDFEERPQEQNWSKLHLARSSGDLSTWRVEEIKTPFLTAASFGGIVRLADGELLLNVYGAREKGSFRHEAGLLRSTDDGETWADYSPIGAGADPDGGPAKLNETDIVQLPDGKLLSMSRTQYDQFPLWRGFSADGGETWAAERSELTGLCPALWFSPVGPPEGTVVIAYHDRWKEHADRGGLYVAFSHDGGRTWGLPTWIARDAYPCVIGLDDGSIFCSYYESFQKLSASIFSVPFPTGLQAASGGSEPGASGITLTWDAYDGQKKDAYTYAIHRGDEANFTPSAQNQIGTVSGKSAFVDATAAGNVYFYRVRALDGDREVGTSWVVGARAGL